MLGRIFAAMKRLANALNRSAELFETANEALERQLHVAPADEPLPLPSPTGNGAGKRKPFKTNV